VTETLLVTICAAVGALLASLFVAARRDKEYTENELAQLKQQYDRLLKCHMSEVQNVKVLRTEVERLKPKHPRVIT
jgi:Ser/Thr protein kinase RdoA (MazF antagonist)